MGHSSMKVTMDPYGHVMNSVNEEAATRLRSIVFGEGSSNRVAEKKKGVSHVD